MNFNDFVAAEVRSILARRLMKQSELAAAVGKPREWVSARLRGKVALNMDDLYVIAVALDMQVRDLVLTAHEAYQGQAS